MKKAIIFGVTGQDGSYLADLLLEKNYKVIGVARRSSVNNCGRIKHLENHENFQVVEGDVTDVSSMISLLRRDADVDEVYNLAAQSHVGTSFKQPGLTWDVTGKGCMNILQCLVDLDMRHVRFYQASSSEMFGSAFTAKHANGRSNNDNDLSTEIGKVAMREPIHDCYQDENTKHLPQSPYAIAKCAAHMAVRLYREAYGIHGSCGILFNHEGPRRGENFVTRKITKWIGEFDKFRNRERYTIGRINQDPDYIYLGPTDDDDGKFPKLRLGNLDAKRDWGHAKDYVRAMWMMLQQDEPDDYVICTGETRSIRDFLNSAFKCININEWEQYVLIDPKFYRPAEVDFLLGDCSKATKKLGWEREYSFDDLVTEMVQHDRYEANKAV